MKKYFCSVFALIYFSALSYAHPPKSIDAKITGEKVDIFVVHNVKNSGNHYIIRIKTELNGKPIIKQDFFLQKNNNGQTASYMIPGLKKGDVLEIEAECNKFGELKKKFTVELND